LNRRIAASSGCRISLISQRCKWIDTYRAACWKKCGEGTYEQNNSEDSGVIFRVSRLTPYKRRAISGPTVAQRVAGGTRQNNTIASAPKARGLYEKDEAQISRLRSGLRKLWNCTVLDYWSLPTVSSVATGLR
jgi:hypothetical protein